MIRQTPGRTAPPTIAAEDWSVLFDAVQERLSVAVSAQVASDKSALVALERLQATVRECVGALQQLHEAQKHHRLHRPTPELDRLGTRIALA